MYVMFITLRIHIHTYVSRCMRIRPDQYYSVRGRGHIFSVETGVGVNTIEYIYPQLKDRSCLRAPFF